VTCDWMRRGGSVKLRKGPEMVKQEFPVKRGRYGVFGRDQGFGKRKPMPPVPRWDRDGLEKRNRYAKGR